jgi:hypothetical protein
MHSHAWHRYVCSRHDSHTAATVHRTLLANHCLHAVLLLPGVVLICAVVNAHHSTRHPQQLLDLRLLAGACSSNCQPATVHIVSQSRAMIRLCRQLSILSSCWICGCWQGPAAAIVSQQQCTLDLKAGIARFVQLSILSSCWICGCDGDLQQVQHGSTSW